ncbi:MAG TPA: hypothetical protein VKW06_05185 [Candidatus Angelobacter sp.]|nr:hypothetical protein [Candidatus Angelobacter sp.]
MGIFRLLISLLALAATALAAAQNQPANDSERGAVHAQMRNVLYRFSPEIAVFIRRLGGELVPAGGASLPIFDDKRTFNLKIDAAEIAISTQALTSTLNSYVFTAKDAPLNDISVAIDKDRLQIKGKLHNKGDLGFECEGHLSATEQGKIRLHVEKIRALHLPVKGLMDLLGVDVADLIKTGKVRGVEVEKDDLILDPALILPPPHISGRVTSVRLENGNVVQVLGDPEKYPWEKVAEKNYMAYRGNRLRFGKLTMDNADMMLIDTTPADPFDFYLDHYVEQLVAGYTKNTPQNGLRVFMPDYAKLHRSQSAGRPAGQPRHVK